VFCFIMILACVNNREEVRRVLNIVQWIFFWCKRSLDIIKNGLYYMPLLMPYILNVPFYFKILNWQIQIKNIQGIQHDGLLCTHTHYVMATMIRSTHPSPSIMCTRSPELNHLITEF
jgi:hypothetical protein